MPRRHRTALDFVLLRERAREHAASQGGAFRRRDISRWGLDSETVRAMVRRGMWVRLHHGLYVDGEDWRASADNPRLRHRLLLSAAILGVERRAMGFAMSAALMHDLPLPNRELGRIELLRELGTDGRALGSRVSHDSLLRDVVIRSHGSMPSPQIVQGVPLVPIEIAAIGAAARVPLDRAVALLDAVLWRAPSAGDDLTRAAADWRHLRGIGVVRQALPLMRAGAQTPLESISRVALVRAGLPEPELQAPIYDEHGLIGYADMTWRAQRVIGEADGMLKYGTRADLIAEKRREDRLRRRGFAVVRWTWDDVVRTPQVVINRVATALARSATLAG